MPMIIDLAAVGNLYTHHLSSYSVVGCLQILVPSMRLTPSEPLQATFKLVPDKFVTLVTYCCELLEPHSVTA
jgi:hypothetical protein